MRSMVEGQAETSVCPRLCPFTSLRLVPLPLLGRTR